MRYVKPENTHEYLRIHAGKLGASTLAEIDKRTNDAKLRKLADSVVRSSEFWVDQERYETHTNDGRGWGKQYEEEARRFAGMILGLDVLDPPIWCDHESYDFIGCSPDGLVFGYDGKPRGVEVKCPLNDGMAAIGKIGGYEMIFRERPTWGTQVQASMWVTGEPLWHFVLYDPRWQRNGVVVGDCQVWIIPRDERHMDVLDEKLGRLAELVLEARRQA